MFRIRSPSLCHYFFLPIADNGIAPQRRSGCPLNFDPLECDRGRWGFSVGVTPKPNGQELLLFLIEVALEASCPVYFVSTRKIKKYNRIIITIIVAFENVRYINSNPPQEQCR